MNPEINPNKEPAKYEIHIGDVMFVKRNLRNEQRELIRNEKGEVQKELQDGWEVVDTNFADPQTGEKKILLRNTEAPDEYKPVPEWRLREIQEEAEASKLPEANDTLAGPDGVSQEASAAAHLMGFESATEQEPRLTAEEAEEIGEEVLDSAGVVDPSDEIAELADNGAGSEPSPTVADIMSGDAKGPLKFDIEAAKERMRLEDEQRLVPQKQLGEISATMNEIFRQASISLEHGSEYSDVMRYNFDSGIVQEAQRVRNAAEQGTMTQEASALFEGMLLASARDPHAAEEVLQGIRRSKMFNDDEIKRIEDQVRTLQGASQQQGREGEHFAGLTYQMERSADTLYDQADQKPSLAYLTTLGMSVGVYSRISPEGIHYGIRKLQGALEHVDRMKK